jgi:hypothetical protein
MRWVNVYTAASDGEALVIRSMLAGRGIPVKTVKEGEGQIFMVPRGRQEKVQIFVPEANAEETRALIKEHQ